MKKIIISLSLVFAMSITYAQVGGLSASKLGTLCTETVPVNTIEFEPYFGFASASHAFDEKGIKQDLFLSSDSTELFSGIGFRFSYGLFKNFEIGVSLPGDISTISIGAKYKIPSENNLSLGFFGGYNGVLGNGVYVSRSSVQETTAAIVGGIIMTYEFSDKFSLDFNAQYQNHLSVTSEGHDRGIFVSTDVGYYLLDNVNFITGFNYAYKGKDAFTPEFHLFTVNPGIAIEKAKNFILVLNAPIDLLGKNEYQTVGFGLALTIILD